MVASYNALFKFFCLVGCFSDRLLIEVLLCSFDHLNFIFLMSL